MTAITLNAKRCPFCNSHNLTLYVGPTWDQVRCLNCNACGPDASTAPGAFAYWNGIAAHQNTRALVCDRASNRDDLKAIEI